MAKYRIVKHKRSLPNSKDTSFCFYTIQKRWLGFWWTWDECLYDTPEKAEEGIDLYSRSNSEPEIVKELER